MNANDARPHELGFDVFLVTVNDSASASRFQRARYLPTHLVQVPRSVLQGEPGAKGLTPLCTPRVFEKSMLPGRLSLYC